MGAHLYIQFVCCQDHERQTKQMISPVSGSPTQPLISIKKYNLFFFFYFSHNLLKNSILFDNYFNSEIWQSIVCYIQAHLTHQLLVIIYETLPLYDRPANSKDNCAFT